MRILGIAGHCSRLAQRFVRNERGAIAIIFSLVSVALFAAMALAIDYVQLTRTRTVLQNALDSALVAAASAKTTGAGDPKALLANYFTSNWRSAYGVTMPTVTYSEPDTETVEAKADATMPTTFAKVLGVTSLSVSATSQARFGMGNTEVALAVDNTGSMSGSKLTALIESAKIMVDEAYSLPKAVDKIKFAVVPFAQYVNVGLQYRSAPWMQVDNDSSANQCWQEYPVTSKTNCRTVTGTYYNDGVPYAGSYEQCDYTYGTPVTKCGVVNTTWNGCVGSLAAPNDKKVIANSSSPVPGLMNRYCNSPLLRLTKDQSTIRAKLDEFVATGDTYIPGGLLWGWRVLSPTEPFADGAPVSGPSRARKVLVLMTDGKNTLSANAPYHEGNDTTAANALTAELCTTIKAASIEIFTVAYEVSDNGIKDILRTCASSEPVFFDAANASELKAAFSKMAKSLGGIRLSR